MTRREAPAGRDRRRRPAGPGRAGRDGPPPPTAVVLGAVADGPVVGAAVVDGSLAGGCVVAGAVVGGAVVAAAVVGGAVVAGSVVGGPVDSGGSFGFACAAPMLADPTSRSPMAMLPRQAPEAGGWRWPTPEGAGRVPGGASVAAAP